ncbi:MAG: Holliday junction resolvase RuvX [Candidatus Pacebacteria bacterium]|nr:Holliday junction resolvase RuvX [Candidatus Paceibacterota bacterium]
MIPKTLAIDYGTKRIGLAISVATLADPLKIIPNNEHTINEIKKVITAQSIKQILIGISEKEMAQKTQTFAQSLKKEIDLEIFFYDETLSSKETHIKINNSHMKKSKKRQPIDHYAASQFLQEWIDMEN